MILTGTVQGRGQFRAKVFKHLSPVTLSSIRRSTPFSGHVNFFERNFVYILTPVEAGEEKAKKEFKRGSVAFMPSGGTICFFLEDTRSYRPMNMLGDIFEGFEVIQSAKRGDSLRVETIV
jgi:uncharacterized protein